MPSILTQQDLRAAWRRDFCYICGEVLSTDQKPSRDHVPPTSLFAPEDRDPPLILPTHHDCNMERTRQDELIGQIVSLLHGRIPRPEIMNLPLFAIDRGPGRTPRGGLHDFPFISIVFRWVRAFHAALNGEFLPDQGGFIWAPFVGSDDLHGPPTDDSRGRRFLTQRFKAQAKINRLDRIVCRNGKCEYGCFWLDDDDGRPSCIFGLRIYEWERLSDPERPPRRGCLGWYRADTPEGAALGTEVEVPVANLEPLDPFGP